MKCLVYIMCACGFLEAFQLIFLPSKFFSFLLLLKSIVTYTPEHCQWLHSWESGSHCCHLHIKNSLCSWEGGGVSQRCL